MRDWRAGISRRPGVGLCADLALLAAVAVVLCSGAYLITAAL